MAIQPITIHQAHMTVYVDDSRTLYRGMWMNHLIADRTSELLAMADVVGVDRRWLQHAGTFREHFDLCWHKRTLAVVAGAVPINWRQFAGMVRRRERTGELGTPADAELYLRVDLRLRHRLGASGVGAGRLG